MGLREYLYIKAGKGVFKIKVQNAMGAVLNFFSQDLQKPGEIVSVFKIDDGWKVEIEVVEESEYMRKHGRHDLMAKYEVHLTDKLDIIGYERISTRERGKVDF